MVNGILKAAWVVLLLCASPAWAGPRVVASVKPIQALVAGVMGATGTPDLLVPGLASPHAYALKPSDARKLEQADLVVWVGPTMETFLIRPLAGLAPEKLLTLSEAPGVRTWPIRSGGVFEADEEDPHSAGAIDGHLWLDPDNAVAIARAVRDRLSALDPANAAAYAHNADALIADLAALDRELAAALAPVRDKPFIVFHDATQYFERHYGLKAVGSVSLGADMAGHAKRISNLRARVKSGHVVCVFTEPQFSPALAQAIVEGTGARLGVFDLLGAREPEGRALYFTVMRKLAASLTECLER